MSDEETDPAWWETLRKDELAEKVEALASQLAALTAERDEAIKERKALRKSLIHACSLVEARHDNAREIWAIRETANWLGAPFSHERVEAKYEEYEGAMERLTRERSEALGRAVTLEQQLAAANAELTTIAANTTEARIVIQQVAEVVGCDWQGDVAGAVRAIVGERDEAVADMEAAEQRMLGVLDGTFSVGDGTAQREIERLRADCERMRAVFEAAAKLVTRIDPPGDWACAECRPNSDMLVAGFQCYVHRIRALTATTPGGDRE